MRRPRLPGPASVPGAVSPAGTVQVGVAIKCDAASHRISPLIYGIAEQPMHHDAAQWQLGATARRWGGNHTSLYNWQLGNAWNTGKDWFFKNVDFDGKTGPAYSRFIDEDLAHGMATALTIPIIGWAAKDTSSYSFPVSVYGPQQATAPENPDIGNGVSPDGKPLTPGSPERTSVVMSPDSIGRWVGAIRAADRARGARGVQMYILGNEPMLWNETHRDVHPEPTSYDELLKRTIAYASAVRKADPGAVIAGPALWGWPAYFGSGVDHDAEPRHPDRDRHGGEPLLPWWLGQVAAHEKSSGQRLLDAVDVHFYPQGEGMGLGKSGGTDPDTAARRIRSVRALWDPDYRDESWIGEPVDLDPSAEGVDRPETPWSRHLYRRVQLRRGRGHERRAGRGGGARALRAAGHSIGILLGLSAARFAGVRRVPRVPQFRRQGWSLPRLLRTRHLR